MNWFAIFLVVIALVLGGIVVFQTRARSLLGWAVVALAVGIIVDLATKWAHTVRLG
jgi:hypothetical protein